MAVHGRFGQPCPDCGAPVQRIVYAENECNYCPACQTGGKLLADRGLSRLLKGGWQLSDGHGAAIDRGLAVGTTVLLFGVGVAIWTLTEYWLHRLVFHWEPDNAVGRRMHFIIHGIPPDHPNDKMRLVMPPSVWMVAPAVLATSLSQPSPTPGTPRVQT